MDEERRPRFDQRVGPITKYLQAKEYLESHNVQKMFESLISSLMLERPENHFKFLDDKLDAIKEIGIDNIDWESFIYQLHPSRDPVRNEYVKTEESEQQRKKDQPLFADEEGASGGPKDENYKPELFNLTEPQEDGDNL